MPTFEVRIERNEIKQLTARVEASCKADAISVARGLIARGGYDKYEGEENIQVRELEEKR